MKHSRKNTWGILLALGLAVGFVLGPSLVWADPPPWAPAHGYRAKQQNYYHNHYSQQQRQNYTYTYYPSSQVYYNPTAQKYYYMNNGTWTNGVAAPASINLGNGVSVNLGGPDPYVYHSTVMKRYPVN